MPTTDFPVTTPVASAADYAEALIVARRARATLSFIVAIALLAELAAFFVARYTTVLSTDLSAAAFTGPDAQPSAGMLVHYVLTIGTVAGWLATGLLAAVLLLIVGIMLVGRLIGITRVTSALIWTLVLAAITFPWQALILVAPFPGVFYTWVELTEPTAGVHFANAPFFPGAFLHWARFVAWPIIALIILLVIVVKSGRGIRQAMTPDFVLPATDLPIA